MPDPCENLVSTPSPKRITLEPCDKMNNQSCILCIVSVGRPIKTVGFRCVLLAVAFFTSADHYRGFGLVRMYVTPYRFSWTIFILDLALSYTDKLLVFRWLQIVLLL